MSKSTTSLSKPHDRFFKQIFSVKAHVESFLHGVLEPAYIQEIDFVSLELDSTNYMTDALSESYADVVYKVNFGPFNIRITFLFEHKSFVEELPYLQLREYMDGIWHRARKNKEKKLKVVIPMIIYHGVEKWEYRSFESYFEGGDHPFLRRFIPSFEYLLVNLRDERDEDIKEKFEHQVLRSSFILMKHIRDQDLLERIESILEDLVRLYPKEQADAYSRTFFVYLDSVLCKVNMLKTRRSPRACRGG